MRFGREATPPFRSLQLDGSGGHAVGARDDVVECASGRGWSDEAPGAARCPGIAGRYRLADAVGRRTEGLDRPVETRCDDALEFSRIHPRRSFEAHWTRASGGCTIDESATPACSLPTARPIYPSALRVTGLHRGSALESLGNDRRPRADPLFISRDRVYSGGATDRIRSSAASISSARGRVSTRRVSPTSWPAPRSNGPARRGNRGTASVGRGRIDSGSVLRLPNSGEVTACQLTSCNGSGRT